MNTSIFMKCSPLLFLAGAAFGQSWYLTLDWPLSGYSTLSSGFGPRAVSTSWFHTGIDIASTGTPKLAYPPYPINTTYKVAQILSHSTGFTDAEYVVFERLNPGTEHSVKQLIYMHIDGNWNLFDGTSYVGGALLSPIQVKNPNYKYGAHLHMTTFPDLVSGPINRELRAARNPFRYLLYGSCSGNTYNISFGMEGTLYYMQLEAKEYNSCRQLDKVEAYLTGGPTWRGDNVIGLNERLSLILKDLSKSDGTDGGITADGYLNRDYNGVRIQADVHGANTTPYVVRYRMYYNPNQPSPTITPGYYSLVVKDMRGNIIVNKAQSQLPICTGCTPPSTAPPPPTSLTAATQTGGVFLSWPPLSNSRVTYQLYRRDIASPGILSADQIGYARPPTSGTTATFLDPLSNPLLGTRPGARYRYSLASVDNNLEGCNGPLAGSPQPAQCIPPAGQTCASYCPVNETQGNMPSAPMPTTGFLLKHLGTRKMGLTSGGTVGITGGETGTTFTGVVFKKAGVSSVALSTTGFLTIPGSFGNSSPPLKGLRIRSSASEFYVTDYGKLATNGAGVIQQYSN